MVSNKKYPKTTKYITIPIELNEKINSLGFHDLDKDYALKFIHTLIRKSKYEHRFSNAFVEMPSKYIKKVTNHRYTRWLYKLLESEIILSNDSYSTITHTCIHYSINLSNLLVHNMWCTPQENTGGSDFVTVSYVSEFKGKNMRDESVKSRVVKDLKSLYFDYEKMKSIVTKVVNSVNRDKFKINSEIKEESIYVRFNQNNQEKQVWMKLDTALSRAEEWGVDLIQDGAKFYLANFEEYLLSKKKSYYIAYTDAVENFNSGNFFAFRNETNKRLDSNITNMANVLTNQLCKDNDLVKFDLSNSQFAILSHILDGELDTDDFRVFKEQSQSGRLYEYILENLNLENRKDAKNMMFELMFSSEKLRSSLKTKLKKLFPSVVEYVDAYKKKHKYRNFSIMLQKKESEIFINGIWTEIKKSKVFCIPKHDCIIVKREDKELALNTIKKHFEKLNFKGKIVEE